MTHPEIEKRNWYRVLRMLARTVTAAPLDDLGTAVRHDDRALALPHPAPLFELAPAQLVADVAEPDRDAQARRIARQLRVGKATHINSITFEPILIRKGE